MLPSVRPRARSAAALAILVVVGSTISPQHAASRVPERGDVDPVPVSYRPPVDAPVVDPFRPPATPYGPGNRGLEYATSAGGQARAIGIGRVTFAGRVADRGVVTVEHPDGLRSSLTGLVAVDVDVGDAVDPDTVLGTTSASLHLGVRRGEDYIDPASLFDGGPARPRHAVLIPVPSRDGPR